MLDTTAMWGTRLGPDPCCLNAQMPHLWSCVRLKWGRHLQPPLVLDPLDGAELDVVFLAFCRTLNMASFFPVGYIYIYIFIYIYNRFQESEALLTSMGFTCLYSVNWTHVKHCKTISVEDVEAFVVFFRGIFLSTVFPVADPCLDFCPRHPSKRWHCGGPGCGDKDVFNVGIWAPSGREDRQWRRQKWINWNCIPAIARVQRLAELSKRLYLIHA